MWSPIVLWLLVGFVCALDNPGWREGVEYVYKSRGRNIANLQGISHQQSGILLRSTVRIQPQSDGKLRVQVVKPEYEEIHSDLPDWLAPIPKESLQWKPLKTLGSPFEVEMKDGRITDLIVSKGTTVWEANMIKALMSQFQLDLSGFNVLKNKSYVLPDVESGDNGVFTTMEDTVTGNTETLYQIRPLPEYLVPIAPLEEEYLKPIENSRIMEVLKHKNYTNNVELPSYVYGFKGLNWGEPATNIMGQFFSRESNSRIILNGTLKNYVIRYSSTINEIHVSPTLEEEKSGLVASITNITLIQVKSPEQKIQEISQPIRLGNLVYSYENPESNEARSKPAYQWRQVLENVDEDLHKKSNSIRLPRSLRNDQSVDQNFGYKQDNSDLKNAPMSPLLPYTMGYEGMSTKKVINVVQEVQKLAKEIGSRMQEHEMDHHEDLLDLFSKLVSLVRIMNFEEVQEAAKYLYSNKYDSLERSIWTTFRDAVGESGTGPALLVIKEWIETKKLMGEEASLIMITMTNSVRQPTVEYFRTLFELVKQPEVVSQWPLNNTILLTYTDLIYGVYVSERMYTLQWPVNSFKPFRTEEGDTFIFKEVIPYLSQQLKEAIKNSETQKIHTLIRAIGNIGSVHILPVFEPYLEGTLQVSQFQRVLMVLAMDKLVEHKPHIAQNVLFRIYQNIGETREVRIAAVYQMIRTVPSAEMLQLMAQYTNTERDEFVKAAVISSIESAANLKGLESRPLRRAALSAKPLLAKQIYGLQHGANYLRTYFEEELRKSYKQVTQIFGSDDLKYPKGLRFTLRQQLSGLKLKLFNLQALTSSLDDLLQVGREQTASYQEQKKQQNEHSQKQKQNQWSSQNIANLLNLKSEDSEQLEGYLYMQWDRYLNMFSFDNRTMKDLPEVIREIEEELRKEREINLFKLSNREMALSFPTENGFPFLFTHDQLVFLKVQGKVNAIAQPRLSQNGEIQVPDTFDLNANMKVTSSYKVQSRLSFITPFNHQQYIAGYDRHYQLNLPGHVQVQLDIKNNNISLATELTPVKEYKLLHYRTIPYTSKIEVTNFEPMSVHPNTKVIKQVDLQRFESTLGKESTGVSLRVEIEHKRDFLDVWRLGRMLEQQSLIDSFRLLWDDKSVQFSKIDVKYRPEESSARKAILRVAYKQLYRTQPDFESTSEWILNENAQPSQRQEELMKNISVGIKNVQVVSLDTSLEYDGERKSKIIVTGAVAKSNVDPKARVMVSYKWTGSYKPQELHFVAKSYIPNVNALDLMYTLNNEPMVNTEVQVKFGNSKESLSKIEAQVEYRRSEERKNYLMQMPMFRQCKLEMNSGNKQLYSCLNMTMVSNLLDMVKIRVQYDDLKPQLVKILQGTFKAVKMLSFPSIETFEKDMHLKENEIRLQARFHPDLQAVNISVKSQNQETLFKNIYVDQMTQQALVIHPVFHARTRLYRQLLAPSDVYRQHCVTDKTHVKTFSNLTYPAEISKHWTVMVQYLAGISQEPFPQQLRSQIENYVILVRQNPDTVSKKDIKIVLSTPTTEFEVIEIDLTPRLPRLSSEPKAKVSVKGQEIKISEKESHDMKNASIQIYALPNGEVKVEIHKAFYVIYDGERARITSTSDKFMKNSAGLCGSFTGQRSYDFMAPQACIARDSEDFIRSFEIEGQDGKQIRTIFERESDRCVYKKVPLYTDVITASDYMSSTEDPSKCTYFQSKYVIQDGETCFTIRAQPTCNNHCRSEKMITKKLGVHCVRKGSSVAMLWMSQIDNGGSPDFSGLKEHKTIQLPLPDRCIL